MTARLALQDHRPAILAIADRHGARDVRVFGSVACGAEHAGSDVDLLVRMEPGCSLLTQIALQQELEQLVGRRVDVVTEGGLSPYLRQRILQQAVPL